MRVATIRGCNRHTYKNVYLCDSIILEYKDKSRKNLDGRHEYSFYHVIQMFNCAKGKVKKNLNLHRRHGDDFI